MLVVFTLLDYDMNGKLNASDITTFIQQILHFQFKIGDVIRVRYQPKQGVLRFVGETKFAPGIWAGVELDKPGIYKTLFCNRKLILRGET